MTGYASQRLDGQDPLGGDTPMLAGDPIGDGGLTHAQLLGKLLLAPSSLNGPLEGRNVCHMRLYTTQSSGSTTPQSGNSLPQTVVMPKQVQPSELWERFERLAKDGEKPKDLSPANLRRVLRRSQQMVSALRVGTKKPGWDVVERMARYADACVDFIITGRGPERPWSEVDPAFHRVLQIWEALDDSARGKLKEHAELLYNVQQKKRRPRWEDPELTGTHKLPKDPSH